MTNREKYPTRSILIVGELQKNTVRTLIDQLPADREKPIEVVIREKPKPRKLDQNSMYWAGPLADIALQAYVRGRTYSDVVWHEFFKEQYLPDHASEEMTKEGYRKYDYLPTGDRVLIGSTTQLTVKGFSEYLEQVIAYGAGLGVMFSEPRRAA